MQVTLANWRTAPFNRWAFHHVREIVPSADIPHDPARVRALSSRPRDLALDGFFEATESDGLLVVHRGAVAYERYANGMTGETPHILMSVSKSMLGVLFYRLGLDAGRRAADILPELRDTAYRDVTLRHLLDMRAGIVWDENYLAAGGPIVEYRKSTGWNPLAPGESPSDLHSFYGSLKETASHGGPFHYVSPNTDLLGWLIERATGRRYADLMSEHVWKPAGAERSAYITVDRLGAPRCAGGMCATLRDLARVGLWLLEEKDFLAKKGDPQAWAQGDMAPYYPGLPMYYRDKWYTLEGANPLHFGMGIHGQHLFVDPANELVIVKFSSQAQPMDAAQITRTMLGIAALRTRLA
jgi:CubicO group peptidase (beta-lactamase class C family)